MKEVLEVIIQIIYRYKDSAHTEILPKINNYAPISVVKISGSKLDVN